MSSLASAEKQWMEGYYGSAVGLTITRFEIVEEDDFSIEYWPVFIAVDSDGVEYRLELSRDPEGNGPGFMFGLPHYTLPS